MDVSKVIFTGGSGLLGGEMKQLLPDMLYPSHSEFDVSNYEQMESFIKGRDIKAVFHAAAFTAPPMCEKEPVKAIENNIIGTANITKLCSNHDLKLFYVSTDYVFSGDRGDYNEEDDLNPVNKYAWSKLGGECAVRLWDKSLIIRTSFGENEFPYPKAFNDQWTSRESARDIAPKMVNLIEKDVTGIVHIGASRRSVYEYAKSLDPSKEVGQLSIKELSFRVPKDTSLNTERYRKLTEL